MRALALAVSLLALAGGPAAAATGSGVVPELRGDGVYVAPDAALKPSARQERELEAAVADDDPPVFVAVLPKSAGDPEDVLKQLRRDVGEEGTYAVVVGRAFRAGSTTLREGLAPRLARVAFDRRRSSGVGPTLLEFERLVEERQSGAPATAPETGGDDTFLYVLLLAAAGGGGWYLLRRRRAARARAAELAAARRLTQQDLGALAGDVQALEREVERDPAAAHHYREALSAYERASSRFDRVGDAGELAEVTSQVDGGRHEMACARAVLEGAPLPERRPACFFDPRHGPSTREVEWSPPGGAPRLVPACEADALHVEEGRAPAVRELDGVPYYAVRGAAPWARGYFGAGLLPTLFVGSLLGSLFLAPDAYGGQAADPSGDFDGGDFDGGDFGGGDFGGGDFGGGDFGGGDF